ncbi:MAG: glycosyltransferase [Candidatus Micrarchaeales archaeon]|jgi:glycosyltransferase involved in cell wall biosynthesis
MLDFLLVIPTLNEKDYVEEMLNGAIKLIDPLFKKYLIVVVDASSDDGTEEIIKRMMKTNPQIRLIRRKLRGQRGADVMYGMSRYESKLYLYIDTDLYPSLGYLKDLLAAYEKGCDVVLGSRYLKSSRLHRPPLRYAFSKIYNSLINLLFWDGVKDHQIGFRLFDRKAFTLLYENCREKHWAWDTEVILLAHFNHLKICEVPIRWVERRNKKTSLRRLSKDILIFTPSIVRLFYRFRIANEF